MKDSDDFHEVCRVTEPPLHYMNDTSRFLFFLFLSSSSNSFLFPPPFFSFISSPPLHRLIVRMVNSVNKEQEKRRAGYTFDAGPNGVLYLLSPHLPLFIAASLFCFPNMDGKENYLRNAEGVLGEESLLVKGGEGKEEEMVKELSGFFSAEVVEELKAIRKEVLEGGAFLKYILATSIGPGPLEK